MKRYTLAHLIAIAAAHNPARYIAGSSFSERRCIACSRFHPTTQTAFGGYIHRDCARRIRASEANEQ